MTDGPKPATKALATKDRRHYFTPRHSWIKDFLEILALTGHVQLSADQVGISPDAVYKKKARDPEFAERFYQARKQASEGLLKEAWRRGVQGWDEVVDYGDRIVYRKRFSDQILIRLLMANLPEHFTERRKLEVEMTIELDEEIKSLADQLGVEAPR